MTERTGELFSALDEIHQRIHDVDIPAWSPESIRLFFVNQIELERMVVSRLRCLRNGVSDLASTGRGFQLVEDLLTHLHFLVPAYHSPLVQRSCPELTRKLPLLRT